MPERPSVSQEDRRRRLSRVVKSLAERSQPVFGTEETPVERERTTDEYDKQRSEILKQAKDNPNLSKLFSDKPVFYENESGSLEIHLEPEFAELKNSPKLKKLLANPTDFIENNLEPVYRGRASKESLPTGKTISELADKPYDVSRVKIIEIGKHKYVVKRVDKQKVQDDLEEYRMSSKAYSIGIPTPKPIGYIRDRGNTYLIFEYLKSTADLFEFFENRLEVARKEKDYDATRWISDGFLLKPQFYSQLYPILNYSGVEFAELEDKEQLLGTIDYFLNASKEIPENLSRTLAMYHSIVEMSEGFPDNYVALCRLVGLDETNFPEENSINNEIRITSDFFQRLKQRIDAIEVLRKEFLGKLVLVYKKLVPDFEKLNFGASITLPYVEFENSVKNILQKQKLKHKDFNRRNVLIKWDKKSGKAIGDENGNAQFYVIDWEQM